MKMYNLEQKCTKRVWMCITACDFGKLLNEYSKKEHYIFQLEVKRQERDQCEKEKGVLDSDVRKLEEKERGGQSILRKQWTIMM